MRSYCNCITIAKMAAMKFLAPLLMLFLITIYLKKLNNSTEYTWPRVHCTPEFKFSALLQKKYIALGYEALNRWLRSQHVNDICRGYSLVHQMILLLGGDIELNPGDRGVYCGMCSNLVRRTEAAMQCSECYSLCHLKCYRVGKEHEPLINLCHTWLCPECNQPNFSLGSPRDGDSVLCSANRYNLLSSEGSVKRNILRNRNEAFSNLNAKERCNEPRRTNLSCLLINCRSLKNKVADLASIVEIHQPDVILGNESWLTQDIANTEIFPDDYNVFRKDRADGHGGVFQAIKKDLIVTQRSELDANCEIIWTQCQLASKRENLCCLALIIVRKHTM